MKIKLFKDLNANDLFKIDGNNQDLFRKLQDILLDYLNICLEG